MKLTIYKWFIGSLNDFTRHFGDNEELVMQARSFWHHLEGGTIVYLLTAVVLAMLLCGLYYTAYNNLPGRHYRPSHWLYFLIGLAVLTIGVTIGEEYNFAKPRLNGAWMLEVKLALCNAIYAAIVYLISSVAICNLPIKTNAYKLFKI